MCIKNKEYNAIRKTVEIKLFRLTSRKKKTLICTQIAFLNYLFI